MIKRRFYRLEHGDKDEASSDSSSSSSDSDVEDEASDDSVDDASAEDGDHQDDNCSASSEHESEESSAAEINEDTSGSSDEDDLSGDDKQTPSSHKLSGRAFGKPRQAGRIGEEESEPIDDMPDCVLQFKSVYRCKICPRVICLTDQTMRVHLKSKKHARSEKQLKENRLKTALNSDGEMENQETPAEMNARIVALAEEKTKKKNRGRQRQRTRLRKKITGDEPVVEKKTKESTEGLARKRRKK